MLTKISKNETRRRVHDRIRKKVLGTAERPRLNVYRSLNHIYVQVVDDLKGVTLVAASSAEGKKEARTKGGNLAAAKSVGKAVAERAQSFPGLRAPDVSGHARATGRARREASTTPDAAAPRARRDL